MRKRCVSLCFFVTCLWFMPIGASCASLTKIKSDEVTFLKVENQIQLAGCALQADGKIVLAATIEGDRSYRWISVSRYDENGWPDTSFGMNGSVLFSQPNSDAEALALSIQTDQKIVVGGEISDRHGLNKSDLLALRILPNGQLDPSFNNQGWMSADASGDHDKVHAMAVDRQGGVLLAGAGLRPFWHIMKRYDFAIARIRSDGILDSTFGSTGESFFRIGSTSEDSGNAVIVSPDNGIFFAGLSRDRYFPDITVLKLTSSGKLDRRFGDQGKRILRPSKEGGSEAYSLALQSDAKLLVGGQYWREKRSAEAKPRALIVRLLPSGDLDQAFGAGGIVDLHPSDHISSAITHIALQHDGRILAFGTARGSNDGLLFARLLPDGTLDRAFGINGIFVIIIDGQSVRMKSLLAQSNGQHLSCGQATSTMEPYYPPRRTGSFIFKLKPNGN